MAFNFLHPPPNFESLIEHAENQPQVKKMVEETAKKMVGGSNSNSHSSNLMENVSNKILKGISTETIPKIKASGSFQKYFTNINSTIEAVYKSITYTNASSSMQQPGKTIQMPVYATTAEVNSIQNPVNGMIIYDTEADKFKFREGGAWVVK